MEVSNTVVIHYCGGWGYRPKAQAIQGIIEAKYPGKFSFNLSKDAGTTGRLEVVVNGHTVHSKAGGDGYVTDANKDKMLAKISELLH